MPKRNGLRIGAHGHGGRFLAGAHRHARRGSDPGRGEQRRNRESAHGDCDNAHGVSVAVPPSHRTGAMGPTRPVSARSVSAGTAHRGSGGDERGDLGPTVLPRGRGERDLVGRRVGHGPVDDVRTLVIGGRAGRYEGDSLSERDGLEFLLHRPDPVTSAGRPAWWAGAVS